MKGSCAKASACCSNLPRVITVNAAAPGPVETELFLNGESEAEVKRMAGMAPLGRAGGLRVCHGCS